MGKGKPAVNNLTNFLALVSILFLSWLLGRYFHIDSNYLKNLLSKFPLVYSGIAFVLLYVVITFFVWFSKDIFRVLGAVIFGAYLSTLFVYIAEMINAAILFNLSRFLGRGFVKNHLRGGFEDLDERICKFGFWGIFVLRITPLVPFRFLDIAGGLTRIYFKEYFLVSCLGSPIRIFWLQFILAAVGLGIFKDNSLVMRYFLENKIVFIFSLIYLVGAAMAAIFLKKPVLEERK